MGELKEYLQAAREKKGLSLRDISDRTRISYTFLEAIEEENFSVIPGEVFVTGFLRTYARELGLDEKEAVAIYRKHNPPAQETATQEATGRTGTPFEAAPPRRVLPSIGSKVSLHYVILAGLALGAAMVAALLYFTGADRTADIAPPPLPVTAEPSEEAFAASTSNAPAAPVLDNLTSSSTTAPVTSPAPVASSPLVLNIVAVEDTWYSYRIDGGERLNGALKKDGAVVVEADEKIVLSLGNAGGVKLTFNGKPAGPFGPKGAVRNGILFTKDVPGKILSPKTGR